MRNRISKQKTNFLQREGLSSTSLLPPCFQAVRYSWTHVILYRRTLLLRLREWKWDNNLSKAWSLPLHRNPKLCCAVAHLNHYQIIFNNSHPLLKVSDVNIVLHPSLQSYNLCTINICKSIVLQGWYILQIRIRIAPLQPIPLSLQYAVFPDQMIFWVEHGSQFWKRDSH